VDALCLVQEVLIIQKGKMMPKQNSSDCILLIGMVLLFSFPFPLWIFGRFSFNTLRAVMLGFLTSHFSALVALTCTRYKDRMCSPSFNRLSLPLMGYPNHLERVVFCFSFYLMKKLVRTKTHQIRCSIKALLRNSNLPFQSEIPNRVRGDLMVWVTQNRTE